MNWIGLDKIGLGRCGPSALMHQRVSLECIGWLGQVGFDGSVALTWIEWLGSDAI